MANSIIRSFLSSRCIMMRKSLLGLSAFLLGVVFCVSAYADTVISDGFIHGYWFENNSVADAMNTSNGYNSKGTFDSGFIGNSIYFSNSAYVRLENSNNTDFGIAAGKDGKMTIMCWYYPTESTTNARVLISNEDWYKGKNPGVTIDAQYLTGPDYNFGDGVQAHRCEYVAKKTVANKWQFVAVSADIQAGTADLYYGAVDGNLQLLKTMDISNLDSFLSSYKWYLASDYSNYDYYFRGYMDEVAFWNRALTQDEVTSIFNNQKAGTGLGVQLARADGGSVTQNDGTWSTDTNWSYRAVPDSQTDVIINHSITDSADRTVNANMTINNGGAYTSSGTLTLGDGENLTGTLTLNGGTASVEGLALSSNSGAGIVNLSAGTLNIGAAGVTAGDGVVPVINLGTGTINASDSHTWSNNLNIKLNDGSTTTFNSDANKTITIESPISGSGALTKTGEGALVLSAANTYSADTNVYGGTLKLTGAGTLGTGSVTNNGTLEFAQTSDLEIKNNISGTGAVVRSGSDVVTLSGDLTYTGTTTINGGTLSIQKDFTTSSELLGSGTLEFSKNNVSFNIGSASDFTGKINVVIGDNTKDTRIKLGNGSDAVTVDLSKATVELNGNAGNAKFSELTFPKTGSKLTIGTLNGNAYSRIFTTENVNTYCDLTVYKGNYAGIIGREWDTYTWVNRLHLTKAYDNTAEDGGTLELSGKNYYWGTTTIQGGTLKLTGSGTLGTGAVNFASEENSTNVGTLEFAHTSDQTIANNISGAGNVVRSGSGVVSLSGDLTYTGTTTIYDGTTLQIVNNNTSANKNFTSSTGLAGAGTLDFVGNSNSWFVFFINADANSPQDFSGVFKATGNLTFYKDANLGNAKLQVGDVVYDENNEPQYKNTFVTFRGGYTNNLTFKELNTLPNSTVRVSHGAPSANPVLTVGSGTVDGNFGEANPGNAWYNNVNLVKASDGSEDGGTLTINGGNYYKGTTTIQGGTLKLTGAGTLGAGAATIAQGAKLEFAYEDDRDAPIVFTNANAISGAGQIVKSGSGVLKINIDSPNSISAGSLVVKAGELDFKGYFTGNIEIINGAVFSPGNSIGTLSVTGDFAVTDGTALFEFGTYTDEGNDHDLLTIFGGAFSVDDNNGMISLAFDGDPNDWVVDGKSYMLVSNGGFTDGGDYSQWLSPDYTGLFSLTGGSDGLYLTVGGAGPEPGSGVPEPSTWALLLLGAAGLLYVRKRTRK